MFMKPFSMVLSGDLVPIDDLVPPQGRDHMQCEFGDVTRDNNTEPASLFDQSCQLMGHTHTRDRSVGGFSTKFARYAIGNVEKSGSANIDFRRNKDGSTDESSSPRTTSTDRNA